MLFIVVITKYVIYLSVRNKQIEIMTTTINQFRVIFKEETIKGLRDFGTTWYDVNFFDAENIIKKYENKIGFELLKRTITKDTNSFKKYLSKKNANITN